MSQLQRDLRISALVMQFDALASIMENALGPHGRSILMERSGAVTITQDGIDLLSALSLENPVLNMVRRGIIDQSKLTGDGCKRTLLLLRCLLRSLDQHISLRISSSHCMRRQKMLQIICYLKHYMLTIQRQVFQFGVEIHPLHNFEALGETLTSSAKTFFSTKFSNFIAKNLAQLFKSYLLSQCNSSDDVMNLLEERVTNTHTAIVEIYNTPLMKSSVTPGFILTREFRHLDQYLVLENVPCVLWSLMLEEVRDGPSHVTVEVSDSELLMESIIMRNTGMSKCLTLLRSMNVCMIFSSVYFPDWAVLLCKKFDVSVIDMIDTEEWTYILRKLRIFPITSILDIQPKIVATVNKIEPITLGNSRFVRLYLQTVHQIILCGPTVSHCKQFSSAFCNLFKYLHHWITDCLVLFKSLGEEDNDEMADLEFGKASTSKSLPTYDPFYLTTVSSHLPRSLFVKEMNSYLSASNPLPLFYSVPPGDYIALLTKFLVLEDHLPYLDGLKDIALSVILQLLNEIPFMLYKKSRLPQDRYIVHNTTFNSYCRRLVDKDNSYLLSMLLTDLKLQGHENPFVFFKILDTVFTYAQFILRIEHVVPSKNRISDKLNCCEESSDDDD